MRDFRLRIFFAQITRIIVILNEPSDMMKTVIKAAIKELTYESCSSKFRIIKIKKIIP